MLVNLGARLTDATRCSPFTNVLGVARSIIAFATLLTLVVNDPGTLFPALTPSTSGTAPHCDDASGAGLFCAVPDLQVGRLIAVAVLLLVIIGWQPRWTCIPHWYVAFSFQASATVVDGGDQIAAVLALILIPVCLADERRWHWSAPRKVAPELVRGRVYAGRFVAVAFLVLVQLQVATIYFNAGIAKLGVREWADGSAMYYWLNDPNYGAASWQLWLLRPILTHGLTVTVFTWSMLLGEVVLGVGVLLPWRYRRPLLWFAVTFHLGIAVFMGLVSFALTMMAADLLTYRSVHDEFDLTPVRTFARHCRRRLSTAADPLSPADRPVGAPNSSAPEPVAVGVE